ncbi:hypothetical protein IMN33_005699, partial [Escherichia coli]
FHLVNRFVFFKISPIRQIAKWNNYSTKTFRYIAITCSPDIRSRYTSTPYSPVLTGSGGGIKRNKEQMAEQATMFVPPA